MNYQRIANKTAREYGYGSATEIVFGSVQKPKVVSHTRYGWRKKTTGKYVPNSYRMNFGWKNTFYQHAETIVVLPWSMLNWAEI